MDDLANIFRNLLILQRLRQKSKSAPKYERTCIISWSSCDCIAPLLVVYLQWRLDTSTRWHSKLFSFERASSSADRCSTLAPLHGVDYITPSFVALAARKIYPHRIVLTAPENERSMQWGSSLEAVKAVLEGVTVEDAIQEVLQSVEAPL
jgi:hypothetical protein